MAPFPVEHSGEAVGQHQRCNPTPFVAKTYHIVEDSSVDDIISWNDAGTGFVVWRLDEFSRDLLPKYFKHNNFASFVRQLNIYGFRKVVPDRWEFSNELFKKGEKALLHDIRRQKNTTGGATSSPAAVTVAVPLATQPVLPVNSRDEQVHSSSLFPAITTNVHRSSTVLVEENDRLRKENSQLQLELERLRGMCDSVMAIMTSYNSDAGGAVESREGGREGAEEETSPRLFGVSIRAKRVRLNDDVEGEPCRGEI